MARYGLTPVDAGAPLEDHPLFLNFGIAIRALLDKYGPKEVHLPNPVSMAKAGNQKYNDGGVLRSDREKPLLSRNSQFKYSAFLTKHLTPRETWVPGKNFKNINSWWFNVIGQIIGNVPYYAGGKEAEEIRSSMPLNIPPGVLFDLTGFGLQFLRSMLLEALQAISEKYPHPDLQSMVGLVNKLFEDIDIEMPNGKHIHPPRGIGLGYFENLKTLCVLALIDQCNPISVFGDQGYLPATNITMVCLWRLQAHGFYFKEAAKIQPKKGDSLLWAGHIMSNDGELTEPRSAWTGFSGALDLEFHWERKAAIRGLNLPEEFRHIHDRIMFQYEYMFGAEFHRAESLLPFRLGGLNYIDNVEGYFPTLKAAMLAPPGESWESTLAHGIPFGDRPDRDRNKKHSLARAREYSRFKHEYTRYSTFMHHYIYPRIEITDKRKVHLSAEARSTPMWADRRMILFEGRSSGRLTSGLDYDGLVVAPHRQRYSNDPFNARARGGYKIVDYFRGTRGADAELQELAALIGGEYGMSSTFVLKVGESPEARHFWADPERFEALEVTRASLGHKYMENPYISRPPPDSISLDIVRALLSPEKISGERVDDNIVTIDTDDTFASWHQDEDDDFIDYDEDVEQEEDLSIRPVFDRSADDAYPVRMSSPIHVVRSPSPEGDSTFLGWKV
jgi:hypothetical protein